MDVNAHMGLVNIENPGKNVRLVTWQGPIYLALPGGGPGYRINASVHGDVVSEVLSTGRTSKRTRGLSPGHWAMAGTPSA